MQALLRAEETALGTDLKLRPDENRPGLPSKPMNHKCNVSRILLLKLCFETYTQTSRRRKEEERCRRQCWERAHMRVQRHRAARTNPRFALVVSSCLQRPRYLAAARPQPPLRLLTRVRRRCPPPRQNHVHTLLLRRGTDRASMAIALPVAKSSIRVS